MGCLRKKRSIISSFSWVAKNIPAGCRIKDDRRKCFFAEGEGTVFG